MCSGRRSSSSSSTEEGEIKEDEGQSDNINAVVDSIGAALSGTFDAHSLAAISDAIASSISALKSLVGLGSDGAMDNPNQAEENPGGTQDGPQQLSDKSDDVLGGSTAQVEWTEQRPSTPLQDVEEEPDQPQSLPSHKRRSSQLETSGFGRRGHRKSSSSGDAHIVSPTNAGPPMLPFKDIRRLRPPK